MSRIEKNGWDRGYMISADSKFGVLGLMRRKRNAITSLTVNGMLLNLTALYLDGDYLEGGRM